MHPDTSFETRLSRALARITGKPGEVATLQRLSGGASLETWSFAFGGRPLILRRRPAQTGDPASVAGLPLADEAALIASALDAGVRAPRVVGVLAATDDLGEGFVMDRVEGETLPQRIFRDDRFTAARERLVEQAAQELARIHGIPRERAPSLPDVSLDGLLDRHGALIGRLDRKVPVFAYALRWLRENRPAESRRTLVHGDFRMGNLMIDENGIAAVLDWELAGIGDPVQDLAYFCTPSWRFGNYSRPAGGVGGIEPFLDAYARFSGHSVERARFDFWLVYSTLSWGLVCLVMADIWRSGQDRSLERIVIGTRVSEVELDLILLLEGASRAAAERLDWAAPSPAPPGSGEAAPAEILQALEDWSATLIQGAQARALFDARVARNALGMLRREAELGPMFAERRAERLSRLGLSHDALCDALAAGEADFDTPGVLAHLRASALESLTVFQPKYAGLTPALARWTGAARSQTGQPGPG